MRRIKNIETKLDSTPIPEDVLTNPDSQYNFGAAVLRGMRTAHGCCADILKQPLPDTTDWLKDLNLIGSFGTLLKLDLD